MTFQVFSAFLSHITITDSSLNQAQIRYKTKSGYGYNLADSQNTRYYWHTGPKTEYQPGDRLLFTFEPSTRCEDRLDVTHSVPIKSVEQFIDVLWSDKNTRQTLISQFADDSCLGTLIRKKLTQSIPDDKTEFISFLSTIPENSLTPLFEDIDLRKVPWGLDYKLPDLLLCKYLLIEFGRLDNEIVQQLEAYFIRFPDLSSKFVFEYSKLDALEKCYQSLQFQKLLKSEKTLSPFVREFMDQIWLTPGYRATTVNYFGVHPRWANLIWEKVFPESPQDKPELVEFAKALSKPVYSTFIDRLDLQHVLCCIDTDLPEEKLCEVMVLLAKNISDDELQKIKSYSEEQNFKASLTIASLLLGEPFDQRIESAFIDKIPLESSRYSQSFCPFIWDIQPSRIALLNTCYSNSKWSGALSKLVKENLPQSADETRKLLEQLDKNVATKIVNEHVKDEYLAVCAEFAGNARLCSFIANNHTDIPLEKLEAAITSDNDQSLIEAGFLLSLVKAHRQNLSMDEMTLANNFRIFSEQFFNKHSLTRSKIKLVSFHPCEIAGKPWSGSRPQNLSFCEGKVWIRESNNHEYPVREVNTLCRRRKCDQEYDCFSSLNFYTLIEKLFGMTAEKLHQNDSFTRSMAAINRWDEIVDLLHCKACDKPLILAEHGRNSMGNMAYSATYWHCNNQDCNEYCTSVKITHCYGCRKVIDSRIDTKSCTPREIRSFKKFYICKSCASCCQHHDGFSGRCPHCGGEKAYSDVPDDNRSRTSAACRHCNKTVSIDTRHFATDLRRRQSPEYHGISGSNAASCLIFPKSLVDASVSGFVLHNWPWSNTYLYVYDLFHCLKEGYFSVTDLNAYSMIYDLKMIEKLAYLGKNHKRYHSDRSPEPGFLNAIKDIDQDRLSPVQSKQVTQYITSLFNKMDEASWKHHDLVEIPFTLALFSLCGSGLSVNSNTLQQLFSDSERARNALVQTLRTKGIDTPTQNALQNYIDRTFTGSEKFAISRAVKKSDFKGFINTDPVFDAMHKIDKIERMATTCQSLLQSGNRFIPDYQIIGSETVRCTSRSPNLLGLPKEFRPIIRASYGMGIVECDYGQMEVGIMAALANDQQLLKDYNSGDVYTEFAVQLSVERDQAKLLFLTILYGVGIPTLSSWLSKSRIDAKKLVEQFYARYESVQKYQEQLISQGNSQGYVETNSGLKRKVNQTALNHSPNREELEQWQTNWFKNYPVQASAATIFKKAIMDVAKNISSQGFKLIAPMYDSIAFEAPTSELERYTNLVSAAMKRAMKAEFPELKPQVKINNFDTSCWNAGNDVMHYNDWLKQITQQ